MSWHRAHYNKVLCTIRRWCSTVSARILSPHTLLTPFLCPSRHRVPPSPLQGPHELRGNREGRPHRTPTAEPERGLEHVGQKTQRGHRGGVFSPPGQCQYNRLFDNHQPSRTTQGNRQPRPYRPAKRACRIPADQRRPSRKETRFWQSFFEKSRSCCSNARNACRTTSCRAREEGKRREEGGGRGNTSKAHTSSFRNTREAGRRRCKEGQRRQGRGDTSKTHTSEVYTSRLSKTSSVSRTGKGASSKRISRSIKASGISSACQEGDRQGIGDVSRPGAATKSCHQASQQYHVSPANDTKSREIKHHGQEGSAGQRLPCVREAQAKVTNASCQATCQPHHTHHCVRIQVPSSFRHCSSILPRELGPLRKPEQGPGPVVFRSWQAAAQHRTSAQAARQGPPRREEGCQGR